MEESQHRRLLLIFMKICFTSLSHPQNETIFTYNVDFMEAFASHPRLGQRPKQVSSSDGPGAVHASDHSLSESKKEQSGIMAAASDVLDKLAIANKEYERRFDLTFIACATGKSAEEILGLITERLTHDREQEVIYIHHQEHNYTTLYITARHAT